MSDRHRKSNSAKVQSGTEVTAQAVKEGTKGVAKGGEEAADTVSHFQYAPTLIALFPVFASFFFGSHTEHWTDLILLGLVAVYLHNCVSVPWGYYKASRRRYKSSNRASMTEKQQIVESQLRIAEMQAFGGLIVGPMLGALLLNYVRGTMARPANGLITNFNITVFVLAAELRPVRIAYEYLTSRSSGLQEELVDVAPARYQQLERRIEDLQSHFKHLPQSPEPPKALTNGARMEHGNDSDLMQIKYALKKFEKHEAHMRLEYENKLYALERKLADLGTRTPVQSRQFSPAQLARDILSLPVRLFLLIFLLPVQLCRRLFLSRGHEKGAAA